VKKKDLIKILERVDDDFEIELFHTTEIQKEELEGMSYPFPFTWDKFKIEEMRDIGHSDKVISFEIIEQD
jgi:hypothetical protein